MSDDGTEAGDEESLGSVVTQEERLDQESLTIGRKPDLVATTLREVFDASFRRLVVQLYGVTGSLDEAEDLVQEAFVRAAATGRRFLAVENPEAWLRTTAVNAHRSRWRKLMNGRRAQARMVPPSDPAGLEQHLELIDALRSLPEAQRHVIALHYLADLPVDQIADELGVPSGTVKSRLSRGRQALAVRLAVTEGGVGHV